jgi:hypothetical protein
MILVGKPEGKRSLVRSRRRWEDNMKWIFSNWDRGHELVRSGSDSDKWRARVSVVMNIVFLKLRGIYLPGENQSASQEGLCSLE